MNDKELMNKLVELSPYSTIPNEAECKELFDYVKSILEYEGKYFVTIDCPFHKELNYNDTSRS